AVTVNETDESIQVDTKAIHCTINKSGRFLIKEIAANGTSICKNGQLIGIRESTNKTEGYVTYQHEPFASEIKEVTVEQDGPVRAVIKVTGRHQLTTNQREWLPFTVRLYFYVHQSDIRVVHTFLYDGNPHKDFIKGLGMEFAVPMKGPLYNRY